MILQPRTKLGSANVSGDLLVVACLMVLQDNILDRINSNVTGQQHYVSWGKTDATRIGVCRPWSTTASVATSLGAVDDEVITFDGGA